MELAGRNDDGVEEEYSLIKIVKILNSIVDDFNSKTHRVHVSSGLVQVKFRQILFANRSVSPTIFVSKSLLSSIFLLSEKKPYALKDGREESKLLFFRDNEKTC